MSRKFGYCVILKRCNLRRFLDAFFVGRASAIWSITIQVVQNDGLQTVVFAIVDAHVGQFEQKTLEYLRFVQYLWVFFAGIFDIVDQFIGAEQWIHVQKIFCGA